MRLAECILDECHLDWVMCNLDASSRLDSLIPPLVPLSAEMLAGNSVVAPFGFLEKPVPADTGSVQETGMDDSARLFPARTGSAHVA